MTVMLLILFIFVVLLYLVCLFRKCKAVSRRAGQKRAGQKCFSEITGLNLMGSRSFEIPLFDIWYRIAFIFSSPLMVHGLLMKHGFVKKRLIVLTCTEAG